MSTDLLTTDQPAPRRTSQGGALAHISPSRLNLWLRCPLAFRFRYLDGIRTPTTPGLFLGKAVHAGLEIFYRHRQLGIHLGPMEVEQRLRETWAALRAAEDPPFSSPAEELGIQRRATALLAAYLRQLPADEPQPLAVEMALETPLVDPASGKDLGVPLVGIVDLLLDGREGPLIVDFKSSARGGEPLEIVHEVQLSSYAYLFRQVEQRQEAALEIRSLIKTNLPKVEFHRYPSRTDAHFRRLFAVAREYLDALDAGRFNYRPGVGCAWCDFREQCSRWAG
jgi:putative RecB family exonuclease